VSKRVPPEVREDVAVRGGVTSEGAHQESGSEGVEETAGEHAEGAVAGDGADTGLAAEAVRGVLPRVGRLHGQL